jgi:acetyl esterase
MRWFRDHYLPGPAAIADWRASPLLAPSLRGVAPAAIVLAGQDVLHDEGAAYAARLETETPTARYSWPGQIHGFVSKRGHIPEGDAALDRLVEAWRAFDPRGAG